MKRDNSQFAEKVFLRKFMINKYFISKGIQIDVIDCCNGSSKIWDTLKEKFQIKSFFAVDIKKKKGRLKIDSSRILSDSIISQNIIDIDTYGSPWTHWRNLLPNINKLTIVFLTIGKNAIGGVSNISKDLIFMGGLDKIKQEIRPSLKMKAHDELVKTAIEKASTKKLKIVECLEVETNSKNMRYLGIVIKPRTERKKNV